MPDGDNHGPPVEDGEKVYRAITCSQWWVDSENRPSSAAFDHKVFSVDIKSLTTPAETAARFPNALYLAEFECGPARKLKFDTRQEIDPAHQDNKAHAHVYFSLAEPLSNKKRKKSARALAKLCVAVDFS